MAGRHLAALATWQLYASVGPIGQVIMGCMSTMMSPYPHSASIHSLSLPPHQKAESVERHCRRGAPTSSHVHATASSAVPPPPQLHCHPLYLIHPLANEKTPRGGHILLFPQPHRIRSAMIDSTVSSLLSSSVTLPSSFFRWLAKKASKSQWRELGIQRSLQSSRRRSALSCHH